MHITKARIAAVAASLSIVGAAAPTAGAATIDMVAKGKLSAFEAPKTVRAGERLTITNSTDPRAVGPHTFSLVDAKDVPTSKRDMKACGMKLQLLCGEIAAAHKVDMKTFKVGKPVVDVGRKGFDRVGDSWFTEVEGDLFRRTVTARPGTRLTYFCAIHPDMVGKLKVTK